MSPKRARVCRVGKRAGYSRWRPALNFYKEANMAQTMTIQTSGVRITGTPRAVLDIIKLILKERKNEKIPARMVA